MPKRKIYSNYSQAIDNKLKMPDQVIKVADWFNSWLPFRIPTGASNCTLNVSLWVGSKPISNSRTILNNGTKNGYNEISEKDAIPGDVIIYTTPPNTAGVDANHSALLEGFADQPGMFEFYGKQYPMQKGDRRIVYSNGSTLLDALTYTTEEAYIDNSGDKEGNYKKTNSRFFRYVPNGVMYGIIPDIYVTPKGNYYNSSQIRFLKSDLNKK